MNHLTRKEGARYRLTHLPTGLVAETFDFQRCAPRAKSIKRCRSILAAKVAKLREEPEWKEGKGQRVRTYHLAPYLGIPPFTCDHRNGTMHPLDQEMFRNGKIDHLLRESSRSNPWRNHD